MLLSWAFFLTIHLEYPFLLGSVSGLMNLVPYLGAVLAWIPPFLIGLAQWSTIGPYFGVAAVLTFLHIVGLNVLMPAIVGRRVHLNALAVTAALLILGMAVGRDRTDPGDSHHGDGQSDLRSRRRLGAGGPLARRIDRGGSLG